MERIDGRSLDHRTLEHLRRLAVQRVRSGEKPSAVVKSLGFCRTSMYKWVRVYRKRGVASLASHKSDGPVPQLTNIQKRRVRTWIVGKDPRPWGFDLGLWTRKMFNR